VCVLLLLLLQLLLLLFLGSKGVEERDWKAAGVPLTAMLIYDDK